MKEINFLKQDKEVNRLHKEGEFHIWHQEMDVYTHAETSKVGKLRK